MTKIKGEEHAKEIKHLYVNEGLSMNRIGEIIAYRHKLDNLSGATVRGVLVAQGVKIKSKCPQRQNRSEFYKRMIK